MNPLVKRRATEVCACHECVVAGVTEPSVLLKATKNHPERWLHGRELQRWLEAERRGSEHISDIAERLRRELGLKAQRGSDPR